jgi:hypothetical protein
MAATESHVYILTWSSELLIVDARDLSIKTNKKLAYEATAMALCNDQVWTGDKKGVLRVYTSDFTDIKTIEGKHSKAVTAIASNNKVVASGDAYRYMFVFDGESHEELFSSGDHKDKILDLCLT